MPERAVPGVNLPLATNKVVMPLCMVTNWGPSTPSSCGDLVASGFINKNKLFRIEITTDVEEVLTPIVLTLLDGRDGQFLHGISRTV